MSDRPTPSEGGAPEAPGGGPPALESLEAIKALRQDEVRQRIDATETELQVVDPRARPKRTSVGRLFGLVGIAIVIGLVAGFMFARTDPRAAAGAVVADFVVSEDVLPMEASQADPTAVVPSSGSHTGSVRCGVVADAIGNDDHLASLAAGVVVIRYAPSLAKADVAKLAALVEERDQLLLSPEPRITGANIQVVSWGKRLSLPRVNLELLRSFHRANEGLGPTPALCPA